MDKKKRRFCFILTLVGILVLITAQTIVLINNDAEEKKDKYVKKNIILAYEKCVKDSVCVDEKTFLSTLVEKEYFTKSFIRDLNDYSLDSYILKNTKEVYLVRKDK